jgi:hypothetical protein
MPEISPRVLAGSGYRSIDPLPANNPQQAGPNCGLYALSYVMRHWSEKLQHSTRPIPQPLPARKVDVEGPVKLAAGDPNKGLSLRFIAKHANPTHPLTFLGELFSGEALATVAQRSGFHTKIHTPATKNYLPTLFRLIDANHPAIVSLDVDQDIHTNWSGQKVKGSNNGCPGKFGGEHAHWAVIVAYEKGLIWDDVVMFHWERYFQFAAGDLRDSSNQLVRFSGQTWFKPTNPAEQVLYDPQGNPIMVPDKSQPVDPRTRQHRLIPARTARGAHWQKLESANTTLPGTAAWNTAPGDYAQRTTSIAPPLLSTNINDQVVKTAFGNTNLNLRNVIIEVVPPATGFMH